MDDRDMFDDPELRALLAGRADALAGSIDTDAALGDVQRRIRLRRRRRTVTSLALAAAAVVVTAVAVGAVVDDDSTTLRSPAAPADGTAPAPTVTSVPVTAAPSTTVTAVPSTTTLPPPIQTTMPALQPATPPATSAPVQPGATAQAATSAPAPPATTAPSPPSRSTFSGRGGSIVVRLSAGAIALDGAPSPTSGWSYRVDDDGPTRVRVRFERDSTRTEIRVDLEDGRLVPEVVEQ